MNLRPCNLVRAALLGLGLLAGLTAPAPAQEFKAGVAERDITPPVGHRMAGYFNERFATGIHDPLKAKALFLEQGRQQVALVFCDLVGVSLNVSSNARAQASSLTGISMTNILIGATHTHTGPLFDDVRYQFFHETAVAQHGQDPHESVDYPALLVSNLVQVIRQARESAQPARVSAGIARQENLAFNRRFHMKDGKVAFNPGYQNPNIVGPAGPMDPDVGLLVVRAAKDDKPLGGVTVFALHSDTVGGTLYSADYAYYLERQLRQTWGPAYVSLYSLGTCGDINHIDVSVASQPKGFEMTERIGTTLGKTVLEAAPGLAALKKPALAVRSRSFLAPLGEVTPAQVAAAREKMKRLDAPGTPFMERVETVRALDLAVKGKVWPLEVQVIRLDAKTAWVGLPCEIFADLGLAIKKASPFPRTVVMSICNDRPSYVPTKKAFTEGSYEVTNARVQPGVGEQLVETALALLRELKQDAKGR